MLSNKYFWRDWYVIAYPQQADHDSYARICGEDTTSLKKIWKNLNILIFSTAKDEPSKKFERVLNKYVPDRDLDGYKYCPDEGDDPKISAPTQSIYQVLPTEARSCLYPIILILKDDVHVAMEVPRNRLFSHTYYARYAIGDNTKMKEKKLKKVFIFG